MATVFSLLAVAKFDPALQLVFMHRTSCCEHNYFFQRFLNNLCEDCLLSNKDLIHMPPRPPTRTANLTSHARTCRGTHVS